MNTDDRFWIYNRGDVNTMRDALWMTATTRDWAMRKIQALGPAGQTFTVIDTGIEGMPREHVTAEKAKGWL